ncbi:arginine deiminase-related protein, partial [Francisella tularensis]|uniref:arginine deiminase-related protein n=1 Tax=Francisella tularensis TaxID=263 RepID=UPI002381BC7E
YKLKDFSGDHSEALEGNAALVFVNSTKKFFLSKSPRADEKLAQKVADELGYELIKFTIYDHKDRPIYQTTKMLSIGEKLIFVCLESIKCDKVRDIVAQARHQTNNTIVEVSQK